MNLPIWSRLALVALVSTLSACSNKIVKKDDLQQVKKVAIIGLDLQQQKSVSGGDLLKIATRQDTSAKVTPALRVESTHVEPVYQDLASKIEKATGWQVMKEATLKKNPAYQKFFHEKADGFQNRPMINDRYVVFSPPGVLDSFAMLTSKPERLSELARELKVDAVVYASATVNLNNSSLLMSMVGNGEFRPSANVSLFVLDARSGQKIYMETVEGPKVNEGAKNALGVANEEKVNTLAGEATGLGLEMVVKDL